VHPAQTTGPEDHEPDDLKDKQGASAGGVAAAPPDEVQTLKAKLAGTLAPSEGQDDELEVLKAKSGNASRAVDVEPMDDVEMLKAKLGRARAATVGHATARTAREVMPAERDTPPMAVARRPAARVGPEETTRLPQLREATSRRQSAFDLAFVLVLFLWGVALLLALKTGAQWWLFVLCSAATAGVVLFGLLDAAALERKSAQE
jgi:hypothetical protein